jgi:hypothetical protein
MAEYSIILHLYSPNILHLYLHLIYLHTMSSDDEEPMAPLVMKSESDRSLTPEQRETNAQCVRHGIATLRAGDIYTMPNKSELTFDITLTRRLAIDSFEKLFAVVESYPQWFLDAHCESRVHRSDVMTRNDDAFVHRDPTRPLYAPAFGKKMLGTEKRVREQQMEKIATDRGKKALHNVLDKLNLDKYQNNLSVVTLDLVREMSIVEIKACLTMTDAHATLLFQHLQHMDDDIIGKVDRGRPKSPPPRQTHVAKGTVTPQPEDKMVLNPSAKDGGETVISNKQMSDGKITRLCVVRHHDIQHLSKTEKRRFFKARYDEEMPSFLEKRASSEARSARKRKRAEDRGGSGAGGGSASGGAPKKKRG